MKWGVAASTDGFCRSGRTIGRPVRMNSAFNGGFYPVEVFLKQRVGVHTHGTRHAANERFR
jgi:hypothetical protein